jgi:ketosteroid isomerase-like protein
MQAREVALRFNDAINRRDVESLVALMTDDHRFVDTAGASFEGRDAARDIWRQFFDGFPDYRNHFETVAEKDGAVVIAGRSSCSDQRLEGPALWSATIRDGKVSEWRVYEDTAERRAALGIAQAEVGDV